MTGAARAREDVGFIDLHAHILPGVDDGPADWDEALQTVRMAAEDGVRHIVSTSHMVPHSPYDNSRTRLLELVAELRERVAAAGIAVEVHAGAEVYLTPDTARRIEQGTALTYGDARRYVLVELPASEIPAYTEQALFEVQLLGVTPIIAHPERNAGVMRDPQRLLAMVERGVLTQVTASSLGAKPYAHTAEWLLRQGAVHFVASDTHGPNRRPPALGRWRERLVALVGPEQAAQLLWDNPKRVLDGEPVPHRPVQSAAQPQGRRSFLAGWLGRLREGKPR